MLLLTGAPRPRSCPGHAGLPSAGLITAIEPAPPPRRGRRFGKGAASSRGGTKHPNHRGALAPGPLAVAAGRRRRSREPQSRAVIAGGEEQG